MLISHTVNLFGNNLLVLGNTGSNSTREALHATEQGFNVGMHASLQINPYYGKTSVPGTLQQWSVALQFQTCSIIVHILASSLAGLTTQQSLRHICDSWESQELLCGFQGC